MDLPNLGSWFLAWTAPGAAHGPAELAALPLIWVPAEVPGTVASALRAARGALAGAPSRLDAVDWWYRCRVPAPAAPSPTWSAVSPAVSSADGRLTLDLDGLATIADVWLNNEPLLHSENMFVGHSVDVTGRWSSETNDLVLRFQSLDTALTAKRPRPRWRAPMIEHQQLRWLRTTLLGHTPGWSPPLPAVGPWRPIRLRQRPACDITEVDLRPTVHGEDGLVTVSLTMNVAAEHKVTNLLLAVSDVVPPASPVAAAPAWQVALSVATGTHPAGTLHAAGTLSIKPVRLWWPHTHGDQALYHARVIATVDGAERTFDLGRIGFRTVRLTTDNDDFAISVNGVGIFCRGACWTPLDAATLTGPPDEYRRTLQAVRDAGMNMLRVGGPMVYETALFHDLCDEYGILVWQDFMFANMDYPEEAAFLATVRTEARQALSRWRGRPSLTVLCGDSEGEQQAAMWGAPPAAWNRGLFREVLPALCRELCPDVPYWPSSASGGAFPHQPNVGSTSYYGVGAYLRPLDDARRSEVRFASETLAFANIPDESVLAAVTGGAAARVHTPAWKAGVPRDLGAGWDFDDVRDHYLGVLFGVDPVALRSTDPERYLALGRVTTGEVMEATFAEWRRGGTTCRGALIWFLRDLVAGAGWGVLDVSGAPKAVYHYLKRILQPLVVFFSNEGLNGAYLHVVNERATPWQGDLRLRLYRDGEVQVGAADLTVTVPARGDLCLPAATLLGGFSDTTYAYRFGPPEHDLAVATLAAPEGVVAGQAFHFPVARPATRELDLGMEATARALPTGTFSLEVRSRRFAQAVAVNVPGFDADDNYFHVQPGGTRRIVLTKKAGAPAEPRGSVQALNARSSARLVIVP